MFENTLLIIKPDYMSRRKCVLLHLLSKGFQIQGNRKLLFTPENAAEFMKDLADDNCYMLYVILLSKGTSEAFILTRENAVQELNNVMVCYFGNSVDMDRNIHISKSIEAARREITFIFPNYIHEPIPAFAKHRFCTQSLLPPLLGEVYDLAKASPTDCRDSNWRPKLSDWLLRTNSALPQISNECSRNPQVSVQEKAQQTEPPKRADGVAGPLSARSSAKSSSTSSAHSALLTSSSCISCSSFEKDMDICEVPAQQVCDLEGLFKLRATKTIEETDVDVDEEKMEHVCEEHAEWVDVYEYEDGEGESEHMGGEFEDVPEMVASTMIVTRDVSTIRDETTEFIEPSTFMEDVPPSEPFPPTEKSIGEEELNRQTVDAPPEAPEPTPAPEAEPTPEPTPAPEPTPETTPAPEPTPETPPAPAEAPSATEQPTEPAAPAEAAAEGAQSEPAAAEAAPDAEAA